MPVSKSFLAWRGTPSVFYGLKNTAVTTDPPSELPLGDGYFVKAVENGLFAFGITDTFSVQNVNISVSVSPTEDIFLGYVVSVGIPCSVCLCV